MADVYNVGVELTFEFADDTTRKMILSPFREEDIDSDAVKASVINFNATGISAVSSLFLSDDGASCTKISAADITKVSKTSIFAKTPELLMQALRRGEPNDVTS